VNATLVYRVLIALRGCWPLVEWLFGWGAHSQVTTFTLTRPYATLIADGIAVALWLTILAGMWFFQRWARLIFVILLAIGLLTSLVRVQRYSLSSPPSFVPVIAVVMLLLTGAIVAMSFLSPVRDCFATKEA
jgi:hypothetical protein